MGLLVVGSIALDDVATPEESREAQLGGAASYFAVAASYFSRVRAVGVVGDDFPAEHMEFLDSLDRSGELYLIKMDSPTVTEIWRTCEDEDTRKKIRFAYARRGGMGNVRLLEKIIDLRAQRARMLGYETTADYQIETRMAQTADAVESFYADLIPVVRKKAVKDLEELAEAKRAFTGDPNAEFQVWDNRFYSDRVLKALYLPFGFRFQDKRADQALDHRVGVKARA